MIVRATWKGGKTFVAEGDGLSPVEMEWGEGKKRFSPMDLLLSALAGCTGIDIVDILQKMRERVSRVEVTAEGERREEHPRIWRKIVVKYDVYGRGLSAEKVEKAVHLSAEKYCSVSAMLRDDVKITHTFTVHEE